MRGLSATGPDVASLHFWSSGVSLQWFAACPSGLSHFSKNLPHQAYTFLTCFFTVCAQGLPHPISDLWLLGHPRATLSSEVYNSNSLKGWPCTARILALAELLGLYGQPAPAAPAPTGLAGAGSDAALLASGPGVQAHFKKDPVAVAPDRYALYAGLSLRCCTLRHRGIAVLQHRRTVPPKQNRSLGCVKSTQMMCPYWYRKLWLMCLARASPAARAFNIFSVRVSLHR